MKHVLMLHGINHNMFGKRDPVQYGTVTLAEIDTRLHSAGLLPAHDGGMHNLGRLREVRTGELPPCLEVG